jgi:hypothetical protein
MKALIAALFIYCSSIQSQWGCPFKNGCFVQEADPNVYVVSDPPAGIFVSGNDRVVRSISDGVVKKVIQLGNRYGIIMQSNTYIISYEGLDSVRVAIGKRVKKNESIGVSSQKKVLIQVSDSLKTVNNLNRLLSCPCK